MKFHPTQKQVRAQAEQNLNLFEAPEVSIARAAHLQVNRQAQTRTAQLQSRVTLSETREWYAIKDIAAGLGAYRVQGWEGMNWSQGSTFGNEAGSLRIIARCDADGVCY